MDCPLCGKPLKEGCVFCENCGKEIQMVPLFEPEIEDKMQKSLDRVIEVFKEDVEPAESVSEQEDDSQKSKSKQLTDTSVKSKYGKVQYFVYAIGVLVVVIIVATGIFSLTYNNSFEHQMQKAEEEYNRQNYENAITYAKRAIEIAGSNSEAHMFLTECYVSLGQKGRAKQILQELIVKDPSYSDAYRELIAIYNEEEAYEQISELLMECNDSAIVEEFQNFCAFEPQYSEEEGIYDSVLSLKLMASTSGEVYYTLDGTTPDEYSDKYMTPIRLEQGTHEVSAVYINSYGVSSPVVKKKYVIDIATPDEPEITVESGEYQVPQTIETTLSSDFEIYYTTDGTTPTRNSNPYLVPIPMPLGKSIFKFVMYSDEGIASNVTTKEYNLELDTTLSPEAALIILKQALILNGSILDMDGHLSESTDIKEFELNSAFAENGQVFYLIVEYLVDMNGIRSKTGNQYAVNVTTSELYRASTNYEGYYMVEAFE